MYLIFRRCNVSEFEIVRGCESQGLCVQLPMPTSWAGPPGGGAALPACRAAPRNEARLRPTRPGS